MRASSLPISSSSASARNRSDRGRCCWRWRGRRRCFSCAKLRCAEADVERCENCSSLIFNAHSLGTHGDCTPCGRVENSSDMRVAAASVSQLLLKSEKLNSSETRGALRCGALPWASGAVRWRYRVRRRGVCPLRMRDDRHRKTADSRYHKHPELHCLLLRGKLIYPSSREMSANRRPQPTTGCGNNCRQRTRKNAPITAPTATRAAPARTAVDTLKVMDPLDDADFRDPAGLVEDVFLDKGEKTTLVETMYFPSQQARDETLKSGMLAGAEETLDRLAELLATLVKGK